MIDSLTNASATLADIGNIPGCTTRAYRRPSGPDHGQSVHSAVMKNPRATRRWSGSPGCPRRARWPTSAPVQGCGWRVRAAHRLGGHGRAQPAGTAHAHRRADRGSALGPLRLVRYEDGHQRSARTAFAAKQSLNDGLKVAFRPAAMASSWWALPFRRQRLVHRAQLSHRLRCP